MTLPDLLPIRFRKCSPEQHSGSPSTTRTSDSPSLSRVIRLCGIFLILFISAAAGLFVWSQRERQLDDARREVSNLSFLLSEETSRSFKTADLVLSAIIQDLSDHNVQSQEDLIRTMGDLAAHRLLQNRITGVPIIDAVTLIKSDGVLINFSRYWPIPEVRVDDRDYFKALRNTPSLDRFVSRPVRNRGTNTWTIYLARSIRSSSGAFIGLALGAIRLDYLEEFYRTIKLDEGLFSLWRSDGTILVRSPDAASAIGRSVAEMEVFKRLEFANTATETSASVIDSIYRVRSAHRVRDFPLIVDVARPVESILAPWRYQAWAIGTSVSVISALLLSLIFWLARSLEARHRVQMERAVTNRLADIASNFPGIIFQQILRPDGCLETPYISDQTKVFRGGTARERVDFDQVLLEASSKLFDAWRNEILRAAATETPFALSYRLMGGDGSRQWIRAEATVHASPDGSKIFDGIVLDVTEAEHAREVAERASREKTRFLAAASHDLRQPLQSLYMQASILASRARDSKAQEILGLMTRSIDALKSMLDGLLDVSHLGTGAIEAKIKDFPIDDLFDQLEAGCRMPAEAKGLRWQVKRGTCRVMSDPVLLGRMVRNLVDNAIKYTESGYVCVGCEVGPVSVRIDVHDTGIGIPAEFLNEIFEDFLQLGNPERDRDKGLGLGLSVVRHLATLLSHPVTVSSTPGKGSVFSITVPRAAGERASELVRRKAELPTGKGGLVVIVDDDALVRIGIASMLRECGYLVIDAGTCEEMLGKLSEYDIKPLAVISDYRLRGGRTGFEVLEAVRSRYDGEVRTLLFTGEAETEFLKEAAKQSCIVVQKPVIPDQLLKLVEG